MMKAPLAVLQARGDFYVVLSFVYTHGLDVRRIYVIYLYKFVFCETEH